MYLATDRPCSAQHRAAAGYEVAEVRVDVDVLIHRNIKGIAVSVLSRVLCWSRSHSPLASRSLSLSLSAELFEKVLVPANSHISKMLEMQTTVTLRHSVIVGSLLLVSVTAFVPRTGWWAPPRAYEGIRTLPER